MSAAAILKRVQKAIEINNRVIVDKDTMHQSEGFTEEYFASLGLRRADLKNLERNGLALRGRTQSRDGHRVRWVLFAREGIDERTKK